MNASDAVRDRRSFAFAPSLALAIFVAIALTAIPRPAGTQETAETTATTPGVQAGEPVAIACDPSTAAAASPAPAVSPPPAATFQIVSEESAVRYRAREELASVGAAEAVGETQALVGQIHFDADGIPLACSRFDADLRTLTSDNARRDNYLYGNTLETERYPLATFVLTAVEGLDASLPDAEETTFTLVGNLTVHGVTKLVAWQATATRDGDTIEGSAWTELEMPDFNIVPPVVGPVVSLGETVRLEVDITARQTA